MPPRIADRLTCKNGHLWVAENIYTAPSGAKQCRACVYEANARHRKRTNKFSILERRKKDTEQRIKDILSRMNDDEPLTVREFKQVISYLQP